MTTPSVHINGSSRESLINGYREAISAISSAMEALQYAAPNARDYYPQGGSAYTNAAREHASRIESMQRVFDDVTTLLTSVAS